jgi:uncharacterized protein YdhG (YjbR/CyaY superfamily)
MVMGRRTDGEPRSKLVKSRDKADDLGREARLEAHRLRVEQELKEQEENATPEAKAEMKWQREASARAKKAVAESVKARREAREALAQQPDAVT